MKRFRSMLALLLLSVTLFTSMAPMTACADTLLKVTTNYLRMRTGPGMDYTVKARYKKGTVVTLLRSSRGWYYVKTKDGTKGWMHPRYLKKTVAPVVKAAESASGTAVALKNVYMRRGPGKNYDRILTVRRGKTMQVVGRTGAWYKVRYDGKTGFVYRDLIKIPR